MNSEIGEPMYTVNQSSSTCPRYFVIFLMIASLTVCAQATPVAKTIYDSDLDLFRTTGHVSVDVEIGTLGKIAGTFPAYRDWTMYEINEAKDGKKYSILFRDVKYQSGGRGKLGIFRVYFDLDWPWPFGAKGKQLDFAILKATPNGLGGINHLVIDLEEKGALLKTFRLDLVASKTTTGSRVDFKAEVKFSGFVDTFFSLERYRQNIEYRVVKVILNLQKHAEKNQKDKAE